MPSSRRRTSPAGSTPATRRSCAARASCAASNGVAIGAQVSYPDLAGFGRRFIDMRPGGARPTPCCTRLGALDAFARVGGARCAYVKPHGALYNAIVAPRGAGRGRGRRRCASTTAALPVLGLPGSAVAARVPTARGCGSSPRGSPIARTRPTARWCRARSRVRCSTDPCARRPTQARRSSRDAWRRVDLRARRHARRGRRSPTRSRAALAADGRRAAPRSRVTRCARAAVRAARGAGRVRLARRGDAARPRALRAPIAAGVVDVVPAARTVLVDDATATSTARGRADDSLDAPPHGDAAGRDAGRRSTCATTATDLARRRRHAAAVASTRSSRCTAAADVHRRVLRLHARLRVPRRARPAAAAAAPRDAAHASAGRLGGDRRRVHGGVPDGEPGRLAPARHAPTR